MIEPEDLFESYEDEDNFKTNKVDKDRRFKGLNAVDYNLNSPLIRDDILYLLYRSRGKSVPGMWAKKNWSQTIELIRELGVELQDPDKLHNWFGDWLLFDQHQYQQGEKFLQDVDKQAEETFEVVRAFVKGWVGLDIKYQSKDSESFIRAAKVCQKFLDLHKITLLMNSSTIRERENLLSTFKVKLSGDKLCMTVPTLGRVYISNQFLILPDQKILMDRNFLLMMKDVIIGRMQTMLSMINRSDHKFTESHIRFLVRVYQTGDKIIKDLGNDGYELIKMVEPICNLRLSDLAREYRPMIPEFPHFRGHIENTVRDLKSKSHLIDTLFHLIDECKDVDSVLVIYGSFRHWGHPFIDYFQGLKKLHTQVTMKKTIDTEYANALASDLARIVLTKEFNEKKRWSVDFNSVPPSHLFYNHIKENTWPTPALIQDFGDHWHELPLVQCYDIPDLIDPSIIYSDKSHSMNRRSVLEHVRKNPNTVIPSKKVLQTMIASPATNWIEFLDMVDKEGLPEDDLVIGLKGKERELKIAGRFFSLMSWRLREYFVITEYLIKTHFVPLFHGLTMADDMTAVIKKMMESSSGQGLNDYSSICLANHIDYEKWNNHQRKESNGPVFRVMGQFLGFPNLISRTHEFFEKSLIYYNGRPDLMKVQGNSLVNNSNQRVCWNGQAGGLEGLRQKGWSILNLLVIQRESKIRNTAVKVLAQGDNQVICTQYKTKQHRTDHELRSALLQMKLNNDFIMEAIEHGTGKLGLLINQDETMQSADYLNYGKVPIFRGVIRGLETKRWSRVTCVTNDQLPTCANLMSSVSTNALTVAHFDVHPLNAMIQFNYFGTFAKMLLTMHDPAIRSSLWKFEEQIPGLHSVAFRVAMLYLDPSLGGVCGTALSRFLIRSFPDPVTEGLSFWKVVHDNTINPLIKRLAVSFGNPKIAIFRQSHIDKLLEDPTALNISVGMSPANMLKTEIKKNLLLKRNDIGNKIVKDAVSYIHTEDESLRNFLWSIDPLFPRFLSEFKSGTFMGVASSVVSLFQNSRTIRNVFRDYLSDQIDELVIKSEISSLSHLGSYSSVDTCASIWKCSSTQADLLRKRSWRRRVLGTTVPHPLEMHGRGVVKTCKSKCCDNNSCDYISVHCSKGLKDVLDSRGPLPAYLGSKTMESTSVFQPWEKESKVPIIRRATRLRDAIHWFVEPGSNLANSILSNISALTGENWDTSLSGFKRTGSALHRFSTSRVSNSGFCAQSPAALTRMMSTTDTMSEFATKNYDFMFQAGLLYSQISSTMLLLGTECSNTVHYHVTCRECIRTIDEPTLESPRSLRCKDMHYTLESWRNGSGSWGLSINQLKPMVGKWDDLSPSEKSYHVGRTLGFLYGDLVGQSSHRSEDSSIFPVSIQKRLRGKGFLKGIMDGLVRASACQVIHRRSVSSLIKPANAIYGGLIYLIDKISSAGSFTNLCREGPIRAELASIPHKIPTSYPTSSSDMGSAIRNYLKFQCKSVELGRYKSDLEDLWLFSDLMTIEFAGPFALSTKILKCLYKPTLSQADRTNIRKLSGLSRILRSQENWTEANMEFLSSQLLICEEEVRHACKFGIPKELSETINTKWGKEICGRIYRNPILYSIKRCKKSLRVPPRIQNPSISGLRLGQLPTGGHYKIRSIYEGYKFRVRDALCGGDGSGGMTAATLRYFPGIRVIFNSILEFDGYSMKGTSPDPPSALETVTKGLTRCVNARDCWEHPSDLSTPQTWEYFVQLKRSHTMNLDLIVLDMEVRDINISNKIEDMIRRFVSQLLDKNGTLIYKTYATTISQEEQNFLTKVGCLFESIEWVQTEFSSSFTSEIYIVCRKLKSIVDAPYPDWDALEYSWSELFSLQEYSREFMRMQRVANLDTLMGIPNEFMPDPAVNLETLLQIAGVPSGIAHQLGREVIISKASGLSIAFSLMSLISHFTLDTVRITKNKFNPPSDNRLSKMASALTGILFWVSIVYSDVLLNSRLEYICKTSFPIRYQSEIGKTLEWNSHSDDFKSKDIRISDKLANIGNWIRALQMFNLRVGKLVPREVDSYTTRYISPLNYNHIKRVTGLYGLLTGRISRYDRSLMNVTSDTIESDHWTD
ncbi:polymerase [Vesiculovirus perinet]|uniref:RNA-directed RNA polymerase L n=2 Tax=Vesiculovirus perinet TaxID=1972569 RepID=I1SV91_9RHAB|nr:polymerase [Vesiculovirus perinet]AEG25355.1 polymerase [Vesiculovirus perinet]